MTQANLGLGLKFVFIGNASVCFQIVCSEFQYFLIVVVGFVERNLAVKKNMRLQARESFQRNNMQVCDHS